jgi:acetyl-CoA/propionyl-CoA carboxylase biotin carboxyl carrier protein
VIEGPKTLLGFHEALLSHECFIHGETCLGIVESDELAARAAGLERADGALRASGGARSIDRVRTVELDGRRFDVTILEPEPPWRELARRRRERVRAGGAGATDAVVSPMQGTVLAVAVSDGDAVEAGQVICIVEAMKMENEVHAHRPGIVSELSVAAGQPVLAGQVICVLSA